MTTREFTPRLDRQIFHEVTTTVEVSASTPYAYDTQDSQAGRVDDGGWRRESDTELAIGLRDSNGLAFPVFTLEAPVSGVEVAWDGAAATVLTLTALAALRNPFGTPLGVVLTFNGPLPAAGTALVIMVPSGGTQTVTQTVMQPLWAGRRDFSGRDVVQASDTGLYSLADSRFIVRAEGPAWDEGDTFIDDEGVTRTVRGVAQIGRSRYLELLARSIG